MTLVNAETGEVVASLDDLEAVIERGLTSFVEVGQALSTIREERLYRQSYDTFEAYCAERWGFGRTYAHRVIEAAEVTSMLPIGNTRPTTESQARALRPLKDAPEQMAEAMTKAAEASGGKPTANAIAEAVADVIESKERKRQDTEELQALMEEVNPEGFDAAANAEAVRQRGEFARLCRDLTKLPTPVEFVKRQGSDLRERHVSYAEAAYAWLDEFLLTVREES